jgi:hypothetical protein
MMGWVMVRVNIHSFFPVLVLQMLKGFANLHRLE